MVVGPTNRVHCGTFHNADRCILKGRGTTKIAETQTASGSPHMTLTAPAPFVSAPSAPDSQPSHAPQLFVPKYGKMLGPEANGILVLDEFTLDPAAARKEQHRFRSALASVTLTLRRLMALRVVIAIVAIANL